MNLEVGLAEKQDRRSRTDNDDARQDAGIVELFADKAEGWEFLTVLPDDALAHLRQLQRAASSTRRLSLTYGVDTATCCAAAGRHARLWGEPPRA